MDYIVLWVSLVVIATAMVLSLVLWRKQRNNLVLLVSILLGVVLLKSILFSAEMLWGRATGAWSIWVQLAVAAISLATVLAAGDFIGRSRVRLATISRVEEALNEADSGLARSFGEEFLLRAVHSLRSILNVESAFIGELRDDGQTADVVALSVRGEDGELFSYELSGTPCADVIGKESRSYPVDVQAAFPKDPLLVDFAAEAYIGVPLFGHEDRPLGVLAILHGEPIEDPEAMLPAMRIIGGRVETELERVRQDRQLRASERRYRVLFEDSLQARFVSDYHGRMIHVNQAAIDLFGYDSREQLLREFVVEQHYGSLEERSSVLSELMRNGSIHDFPLEVRRRDGSALSVRASAVVEYGDEGRVAAIRTALRDVTREHELQRQLVSSQRMEAVGLMAGGVAHDFNNMLTIINGHSDLLLGQLDEDSPSAAGVKEIKAAAQSAAAFTRRLLLLSRRQVLAPEQVDLNQVMRDLSLLLEKAVGAAVTLDLDLQSELGYVIADSTEMEQVLLNLVMNSRDAMPNGGRVSIATRRIELDEGAALERGVEPGGWVELEVSDNGLGMDPAVVDRIFEPFFTTKDLNIGTGLGLSTVYGIVHQLGGDVAVRSVLGEGTTFSILIPPAPLEAGATQVILPTQPQKPPQAKVLVVDDEQAVRDLLRRALERQGHKVFVAGNGQEALECLAEQGRIDLLISDVLMPGLHGDRLAALAREQQSDLPVLLISGNGQSNDPIVGGSAPSAFLSKPFSTQQLGTQVRKLLRQGQA